MATSPAPMPDQQGSSAAPPQDGGGASPQSSSASSAPANPLQMLLAKWYQTAKQMAASDPRLAPGAEKIAAGIQEMQTALVSPSQPTPMGQQPQ